MKTLVFIMLMGLFGLGITAQITHTVQPSGFSFSPSTLTISARDSVRFNGTANHPVLQVSEATWNSNGNTALQGGFSLITGSGTVAFPDAGNYFYVCSNHVASEGMKGKIIVQAATTVTESLMSDKLSVFPSPLTGDELTVFFRDADQQPVVIEVFNTSGILVTSLKGYIQDGRFLVNCARVPEGLFVIKLQAGGEEYFSKFLRF